jgi:predicted regulator of Ras-like GTPase activity (Roadblock/LC7/MglB family)
MDSKLENQLTSILIDLNRIDGVESSLISDNNGNVICHSMSRGTDTSLFGPMAHVITSSSKRLLNSGNQGEIERVLVESKKGKALFLHLGNVHFILLMEVSANVGFVMVSAKRAALNIIELTKDIIFEEPVEEIEVPEELIEEVKESVEEPVAISEEVVIEEPDKVLTEVDLEGEEIKELVENITETKDINEAFEKVVGPEKLDEIIESPEFKSLDDDEAKEKLTEMLEIELEEGIRAKSEIKVESEEIAPQIEEEKSVDEIEIPEEIVEEIKEPETRIPVIKPPISFPKLPEDVQIPEDPEKRANLVLDIYESIFLAMSIGASRIMGVSPARGLIKRFLPLEDCKSLLKDVDVKSNSAINFDKIRENTESISIDEREKTLITDFSKIIDIITENYGKVMGYGAFRGIVRAEFKVINSSYGKTMDELGIKDKIHPELAELFK